MKIYALCSWYDEHPDHLRRLVASLNGFCDVFVSLDGAYSTFPDAQAQSPCEQRRALQDAAYASGMAYKLGSGYRMWESEVAKRAALFELGRNAGATPDDWFLVMDADMALGHVHPETRDLIAGTSCDVAEQCWHNIQVDGKVAGTYRMRFMYRALAGLTVERAHYLYTVPDGESRRFLWHRPDGHLADEPILDLYGHMTLQHFNSSRDGVRKRQALKYYEHRDANNLEAVGDWV